MSDYKEFLKQKKKSVIVSGFDVDESEINKALFPFQKFIVARALKAGKYAIFADCGLGKTLMQLEWARQAGGPWNIPSEPGEWIGNAQELLKMFEKQ